MSQNNHSEKLSLNFPLSHYVYEEYYETAEALRDLDRQYQHFTRTVWKASKQLLKFDEINRLVAYEVEEKAPKTTTTRASGGSRSTSSKSTGSKSTSTKSNPKTKADDTQVPDLSKDFALELNLKDILFSWLDLDWEKVMATLIDGLTTISGGLIGATIGGAVGGLTGGPIGLGIGLTAGLVFGILADNFAFNWDGKLDKEEFFNAIKAILPAILGGVAGVVIGGPAGAAIGLTIGTLISLNVMHFDYSDIIHKIQGFFVDLTGVYDKEGRFDFKLPHLTVTWQELGSNSILARYLGITAIPHMGVEWYARGGIVDGATLIGAGEQGREAIIPLERHTEWIRMVAVQLKEELEKLTPPTPQLIRKIPVTASAMVPYAATVAPAPVPEAPDLSGLADTIARAIAELGNRPQRDQEIRVFLDGRQLSDAVTKYQRRDSRANGG